jgi:hypothetical protein
MDGAGGIRTHEAVPACQILSLVTSTTRPPLRLSGVVPSQGFASSPLLVLEPVSMTFNTSLVPPSVDESQEIL